mgnify:CR=1 FL=1
MSKVNPTRKGNPDDRLAGGFGNAAAPQSNIDLLRRAVLANLLWEDVAYQDGKAVTAEIDHLVPLCFPQDVYDLALEARLRQKLRHTPLYLAVCMCRSREHRSLVGKLLPQIITRADMLTDFLALYWKDGRCPLCNQAKVGLGEAFHNFDEYQFAKYDRDGAVKLRDVMFLARPVPRDEKEAELFRKIAERALETPKTWEVMLSSGADKKQAWTELLAERRLGRLAILRNISGMKKAGVDQKVILDGLESLSGTMLLPLDYLKAARMNPEFKGYIEQSMANAYKHLPVLPGNTLFIVDVSGSMEHGMSESSSFSRRDAAAAMAMLAVNQWASCRVVCTAGDDYKRKGAHEFIQYPARGFALCDQILDTRKRIGGGGIFTRQVLEWCRNKFSDEHFDRIIIFSDSQDCDLPGKGRPEPFGTRNYICDVSAHTRGINYKGVWTAEISGFSENFLTYIGAVEGLSNQFES